MENKELPQRKADEVSFYQDPLHLDLDDDILVSIIDQRIRESQSFFDNLGYKERRKKNKKFLFGEQIDRSKLKRYESDYVDNLLYESENTIKPIALSSLPDLVIKPGNEDPKTQEMARDLTKLVNSDLRKRENRKVLGLAFKHVPVFFQGVIKCVWDPTIGRDGDYKFVVVHPENIVVDHTATTNNSQDMDFVAEFREESVKNLVMMFPDKEKEIINKLIGDKVFKQGDEQKESKMASKIKFTEVWFTWYDQARDEMTGERKYELVEGVIWKYQDLLLGKMRNPYWDWQGEKNLFVLEMNEKKEATMQDMISSLLGTKDILTETIYRNYFSSPRKPYIFLNYDQFGEHPLDATSRIEQTISLQKTVNKRGAQITEMNDRSKPKFIFNAQKIDKEVVEKLDLNDPDQDVMVSGDVRESYGHVQSPPAPPPLYTELETERQKAFSKMGTNATTRGVREGKETATARQLFKEADYGRIDDIVEETINDAAEQMAQWAMQMIKLFYTVGHMKKLLGKDGEVTFKMITQDDVQDGMEVITAASGVDKMQTKREAFERAKMKLTDPLTFFIDTGASDPVGRTKKLMTFLTSPELYLQQFVMGRNTEDMAAALNQQPPTAPPQQSPTGPMGGGNDGRGGGVSDFFNQINPFKKEEKPMVSPLPPLAKADGGLSTGKTISPSQYDKHKAQIDSRKFDPVKHDAQFWNDADLRDAEAAKNYVVQDFVPDKYKDVVIQASRETGVPVRVIAAKIMQESSWNDDPSLRSSVGAQGLGQFMPETAAWWAKQYGEFDPLVPEQAIPAAAAYLSYLKDQIGRKGNTDEDWLEALKAYNAGPGNYAKYNGQIPFDETVDYVDKIRGYMYQ